MRIYQNFEEAYADIERELVKFGVTIKTTSHQNLANENNPKYYTKELQGYGFTVLNSQFQDAISHVHKEHQKWVADELDERLFTEGNPGTNWLKRKEYWEQFMVDGKFHYSYPERMKKYINDVITCLINDPFSRRAILSVWDQKEDGPNIHQLARVSCSMYYQLLYREGKLDIIYTMRSTDFYEHFRNDCALACGFRDFIASQLGMKIGRFQLFAGSLHAYNKDLPKEQQVV